MTATCATCRWWLKPDADSKLTFCTLPAAILPGPPQRYPIRPATDWCGEHTPKTTEPVAPTEGL